MATVKKYTTGQGLRWAVRYRKPNGQQTFKRGFLTKTAAEAWLQETEVEKRSGRYVDPARGRAQFGELAETWHKSLVDLATSTRSRYRYSLDNQVLPVWDSVQIADITAAGLQDWIGELDAGGCSPSTISKAHSVMKQVLDLAVRDRRIPHNPSLGLRMPRQQDPDPIFLTMGELMALADAAGVYRPVILTLGLTGLRWGEMAALKVKRWDPIRRRLSIRESVTEVDGHTQWGPPKNRENRTVPVPILVAELIDEAVQGKGRDDLIFAAGQGSVLRANNARRDWFDPAVLEVFPPKRPLKRGEVMKPSVGVTPHDLRHTAASLAISVGANVKSVQRMLGHKSAAMTFDLYGHLFDDDLDAVADALQVAALAETGANVIPLRSVGEDS